MLKRLTAVWLLLCLMLCLIGCDTAYEPDSAPESSTAVTTAEETTADPEITQISETETILSAEISAETEPQPQTFEATEDETLPPSVEKDGSYTTPEDVAEYIHTFGTLPGNFITKKEAQALGWVSSEGNLWEVAPGKSIGGDYFGNYEGLLPDGNYHECDVNFDGGYRGSERIIYGDDGSIWYTGDHYQSFAQLY